jgi:hypothetical protein
LSSEVSVFRCAAIAAEVVVTFWAVECGDGPVEEMVRWMVASSGAWVRFELPVQVIMRGPGGMVERSREIRWLRRAFIEWSLVENEWVMSTRDQDEAELKV